MPDASAHKGWKHAVAIVGGAVAGSEAARILAEAGVLAVVFEQNDRPYGKIVDGLPRWHVLQREKECAAIDARLDHPNVRFLPRTGLGRDLTLRSLLLDWRFDAVLLAIGAWRDRPLPVPGIDRFVGRGLAYQNPLVHAFNHAEDPGYRGPRCDIPDGAIVIGGGLASIDVIKIVQLELVARRLREMGIREDVVALEHRGLPEALGAHGLEWKDLGLRGGTLFYRRRKEDMPLAWPAPAAPAGADAALARAEQVRAKIIDRALERFLFRFEPCRVPVSALVDESAGAPRLAGLVMARVRVAGRAAHPERIPGSEEEVRAPLVIGSIGSVPTPIDGIPMEGELYRVRDRGAGALDGLERVYALGNVVTGQGNIRASLEHAGAVATLVAGGLLERLAPLSEPPPARLAAILARVGGRHRELGFESYRAWIAGSR